MTQHHTDADGELRNTERAEFDKLSREFPVSPQFERRLLRSLTERQLLRGSVRKYRSSVVRVMGLAAAALVFFLLGRQTASRVPDTNLEDATFAFFLYEDESFQRETTDNYPERFSAYNDWIGGLRTSGQFVTGLDFGTDGVVVQSNASIQAGNPIATEGTIGSMFLVRARSLDEALDVARAVPHLEYGGRVAVRPIVPVASPETFVAPQ